MPNLTGKFKDPQNPHARLYGEVLSTHNDLHFVQVTRRNLTPVEPFNIVVPVEEFISSANSGANKGYWRKQLRDSEGKFVEMGGGIEWTDSKGKRRLGTVEGFDDTNERVIVHDPDGKEYKLSSDEIKQNATKAIIPDKDENKEKETPHYVYEKPGDSDEGTQATKVKAPADLDLESIRLVDPSEPESEGFDIEEFLENDEKFPVGGKPLEIKDKNGNIIGTVQKVKSEGKSGTATIFNLFLALLPHDLRRLLKK